MATPTAQAGEPPSANDGQMAPSEMVKLWTEALATYERDAGTSITAPELFDSPESILQYVQEHEQAFTDFRAGRRWAQRVRGFIELFSRVVQTLCEVFGEAVTMPFSPVKAVFVALSVVIKASMKVSADLDAILDALDTIKDHLRIIEPIAAADMHAALREASVKLLAQILRILGLLMKLQKDGRLKMWAKKICQSKEVSSALSDLGRLVANHHRTVTAATLVAAKEMTRMLENSLTEMKEDADVTHSMLQRLYEFATGIHMQNYECTLFELQANRTLLEDIRNKFLDIEEQKPRKDSNWVKTIYDWLEFPNCSPKLNKALRKRANGTGIWLLENITFRNFKQGDEPRAVWLHGKAGSGKTTLMAAAIRDLQACSAQHDNWGTAYHFFDVTDASRQRDLRSLLSSLICQVAYFLDAATQPMLEFHDLNMHGKAEPPIEKLRDELLGLLALTLRAFVVVDAVDEVEDAEEDDVVSFLRELSTLENVRLLVSSRSEVPWREDLEDLFHTHILVHTSSVKMDISLMLNVALDDNGPLRKAKLTDRESIRREILDRADGNFRWASLLVDELARVAAVPGLVRYALQDLPKTLSDLYAWTVDQIPERQRPYVHRLLIWLLYSRTWLTKVMFAELMAFELEESENSMPRFDSDLRLASPDQIMTVISSTFVSNDEGYVQLAHATVMDYLFERPPASPFRIDRQLAHCTLVRMCLAYLHAVEDAAMPREYEAREAAYPLYQHAVMFWPFYAIEVDLEAHPDLKHHIVGSLNTARLAREPYRRAKPYGDLITPLHAQSKRVLTRSSQM